MSRLFWFCLGVALEDLHSQWCKRRVNKARSMSWPAGE